MELAVVYRLHRAFKNLLNSVVNNGKEILIMPMTMREQREALQKKQDEELVAAVEFELAGSIGHAGGLLTGFSVKYGELDCLLTLRARVTANDCIAFVGAPTLADCFRKSVVQAYHDGLRWKVDEYPRK